MVSQSIWWIISVRGRRNMQWATTTSRLMDEVKDLEEVRWRLYVPEHMVNHLSGRKKKHAVGNYYLQTHPRASWEDLTESLYCAEQYNAVEMAKQHLPKGMWRLCAQYMCGMCGMFFVASCSK